MDGAARVVWDHPLIYIGRMIRLSIPMGKRSRPGNNLRAGLLPGDLSPVSPVPGITPPCVLVGAQGWFFFSCTQLLGRASEHSQH
jgi:hypothetical protein